MLSDKNSIRGFKMKDQDKTKNIITQKYLTLTDVPFNVACEFRRDVKERYGDVYWVKLMDLMRKAEAYDMFVCLGLVPQQEPEVQQKEEESSGIKTFTGEIKNGNR